MGRARAVGYLRVSTDGQLDGYGLEAQEQDVRACADRHGLRLVAVERDEGVSGAVEAEDRPGLADVLDRIADGRADALVVAKLDRLARSLTVQEAALGHVWRHGGTVYAADVGEVLRDDPDDPMRTALRQVVGVFAELEAGMIRARMRAGRRLAAAEGRRVGGRPPFGYAARGGALVPVEEEQETLRRVVELREAGRSLREVAAILTDEGHEPRGARWHPTTLARIVERAS